MRSKDKAAVISANLADVDVNQILFRPTRQLL